MKKIFIEDEIDSFRDFHDRAWFKDLFEQVESSDIASTFDRFAAHWYGAARAFTMPWLFVNGVFDAINIASSDRVKTRQKLWDEYLKIDGFNVGLWKIAEGVYSSTYYAYENLVVSVLNQRGQESVSVRDPNFISSARNFFGEALTNKLWNDSQVAVAREVRNCLAHRGGDASPRLLRMRPLPMIDGNEILISATDVRSLHEDLKPRVSILVEYSMKNS